MSGPAGWLSGAELVLGKLSRSEVLAPWPSLVALLL